MLTNFRTPIILCVLTLLIALPGCKSGQKTDNAQTPNPDDPAVLAFDEEAANLMNTPIDEQGILEGQAAAQDAFWTIILARIGTADAATLQTILDAAHEHLPTAKVSQRPNGTFLTYGRFDDPASDKAQDALGMVHEIALGSVRPYRFAFLAPPTGDALAGSNPDLDLRNARANFGKDALYTLQVGIYGTLDSTRPSKNDLAEFRAAAEQAVRVFRAEGELAFYYHAPSRSTVTVGIFGPGDHDPKTTPPLESPALREARQRHPHNLLNGATIKVRQRGGTRHDQPSFLVAIPKQ